MVYEECDAAINREKTSWHPCLCPSPLDGRGPGISRVNWWLRHLGLSWSGDRDVEQQRMGMVSRRGWGWSEQEMGMVSSRGWGW